MLSAIAQFLLRPRSRSQLAILAVGLAAAYMAMTFDWPYILGTSRFWQNPVGPWLMDAEDRKTSVDMLAAMAGYSKYAQSDWRFPLLLIPGLGPSHGTSGIFLDLIPIVAVPGKILTRLTGSLVNPYGVWTVAAFILSALFAALIMAETQARHYLGAVLAAIFAISAPPLLHRFGHPVLFGQFPLLIAIWLCLIDRHMPSWRRVSASWTLALCLSLTVGVYIFVLTGAIYTASWIERHLLRPSNQAARIGEPLAIAVVVAALMVICGHFGQGTTAPFSNGYGLYSMNVAAPFWPQRSGLLPGFWPIIDATDGQYEGFNYFGAGGLLIILVALIRQRLYLRSTISRHKGFFWMAVLLTAFALSDRVYLFTYNVLDLRFSWRFDYVLGTFRSSGRFFWPVYYATLMASAVGALAGLPWRRAVALGLVAIGLQLVDTEPLRSRMTTLSRLDVPMSIDAPVWQARMLAASAVFVAPSYGCGGSGAARITAEFGLLAGQTNRPTNTVYNPRGTTDCRAENDIAATGPWQDTTLYVFLAHMNNSRPDGYVLPGKHCGVFAGGSWCLGRTP